MRRGTCGARLHPLGQQRCPAEPWNPSAVGWAAAILCFAGMLGGTAYAAPITVDDCLRAALVRAPAARAAAFDAAAAAAQVRTARAAYAPRLLAHGEYGRAEGFDEAVTNGGSTAAVLTVEATLFDGGLRDAQFAAARARLRSATARQHQQAADVVLAVRSAYFAAMAARTESAIQRDAGRMLDGYVTLLRRQETLGLVPHNDVLRAQIAADTTHAAGRAAEAQLDAAREELRLLSGLEVGAAALTAPAPAPFVAPSDAMIDASPTLADARAAVEAARRDADAVRAEWSGSMTLSASGGALGVDPGPTFRHNGGGEFLLGVTVPLFDGGATAGRIAAAGAAADAAEANLQQVRQTMAIALAHAAVAARQAEADLAAWRRIVPHAAEDFELMRARYVGGGNVRLLEVLDALTQYTNARLNVPRGVLAAQMAVATEQQILGETVR